MKTDGREFRGFRSESSSRRALQAPPRLPTRVDPPEELVELGGVCIAELGTPSHPLAGEKRRRFWSREGVRYVAMFAVGAMLGGPVVSRAVSLSAPGPVRSAAFVSGRSSDLHGSAPVKPGNAGTPAVAAPPGPSCSATDPPPLEQLIELPQEWIHATPTLTQPRSAAVVAPRARRSREIPKKTFFDPDAASSTVRRADVGALYCGEEASGPTDVSVTFAPSGQATHATVDSGRALGTLAGSCIAARLRNVHVASFDGTPETVRTRLELQ